jgi:hypothetical protein
MQKFQYSVGYTIQYNFYSLSTTLSPLALDGSFTYSVNVVRPIVNL